MDSNEFFRRMRGGDGPDWRWERAGQLLVEKSGPDDLDDSGTIAAWRLRGSAMAARGIAVTTARLSIKPELSAALQIYAGGNSVRWEIEARLLAGESPEIISRKCNVCEGVILMFCDVFFDVRDRLQASDWLIENAVGMRLGSGETPSEAQVWKYAALSAGPILVDVLVADFYERAEPQVPNRHELVQKARFIALEAVTGYSPEATKGLIRAARSLFGGSARGKASRAEKAIARELSLLKLLADLQSKGERGRRKEQREQHAMEKRERAVALSRLSGGKKRRERRPATALPRNAVDPQRHPSMPATGASSATSSRSPIIALPIAAFAPQGRPALSTRSF